MYNTFLDVRTIIVGGLFTMSKPTKDQIKAIEVGMDDKITLVNDSDARPRREGTKAAKIFAIYKNGMTVTQFLDKAKTIGGSLRNIRKDVAYGRISLQKAA